MPTCRVLPSTDPQWDPPSEGHPSEPWDNQHLTIFESYPISRVEFHVIFERPHFS